MNRVCAALLGLAALAGPGCVSALSGGASVSAPAPPPAERSAGEAWDRVRTDPGANRGSAYGAGFRAGFVAATGGGGTTAPDDWRAGFRHGAATACEGGAREPNGRSSAHPLPAFPTTTPDRPQAFSPAPKSFFVSEPLPPAPVVTRTAPPAPTAGPATSDRSTATRTPPPAPAPPVVLAQSQSRPEPTRPPVVVVEVASPAPAPVPPPATEFGPWRPAKPLPPPSVVRDP